MYKFTAMEMLREIDAFWGPGFEPSTFQYVSSCQFGLSTQLGHFTLSFLSDTIDTHTYYFIGTKENIEAFLSSEDNHFNSNVRKALHNVHLTFLHK